MDYEKKSKKGKKKGNKEINEQEQTANIETITQEKLKNYFGMEVTEISKENLQKFLLYIEKYESIIKSKESKNISEIYDINLSNVFILI